MLVDALTISGLSMMQHYFAMVLCYAMILWLYVLGMLKWGSKSIEFQC